MNIHPRYLKLSPGELQRRSQAAVARLAACDLCARHCRVDRLAGKEGLCRTGRWAAVASAGPHFGEERPLVGYGGSGTIFFSACNLACVFCQNYDISRLDQGHPLPADGLASLMLDLQEKGCENINFVSPSHVTAQILEALPLAVEAGLRLPLVYNTGGYDSREALQLLDGIVDIYMPDMKYADEEVGRRLSGVTGYASRNRAAVLEMHRQVGDLLVDERGLAVSGLLVRHLVLPEGLAGTPETVAFLATAVSPATYVNIMGQYRPCHGAHRIPGLNRRPRPEEMEAAVQAARAAGLTRLDGDR